MHPVTPLSVQPAATPPNRPRAAGKHDVQKAHELYCHYLLTQELTTDYCGDLATALPLQALIIVQSKRTNRETLDSYTAEIATLLQGVVYPSIQLAALCRLCIAVVMEGPTELATELVRSLTAQPPPVRHYTLLTALYLCLALDRKERVLLIRRLCPDLNLNTPFVQRSFIFASDFEDVSLCRPDEEPKTLIHHLDAFPKRLKGTRDDLLARIMTHYPTTPIATVQQQLDRGVTSSYAIFHWSLQWAIGEGVVPDETVDLSSCDDETRALIAARRRVTFLVKKAVVDRYLKEKAAESYSRIPLPDHLIALIVPYVAWSELGRG